MAAKMYTFRSFLAFSLLSILLAACSSPVADNSGVTLGYQPPLIPVKVSVDTKGVISVSTTSSVVTPIGIFSVGLYTNPSEYFNVKNTLTVRQDGQDTIYPLSGPGKIAEVHFSPGYEILQLKPEGQNLLVEVRQLTTTSSPIQSVPPLSLSTSVQKPVEKMTLTEIENIFRNFSPCGREGIDFKCPPSGADFWQKVSIVCDRAVQKGLFIDTTTTPIRIPPDSIIAGVIHQEGKELTMQDIIKIGGNILYRGGPAYPWDANQGVVAYFPIGTQAKIGDICLITPVIP